MKKLTTAQRLWIKLFRGDRDLPHGSIFILMFLNKLKVIDSKQFYDQKDKIMDTVYLWDVLSKERAYRSSIKDSARSVSYGNKRAPKTIKPTRSR